MDGHELSVTSLDKQLWPGAGRRKGATKRDLLRYLTRVSPYLLPHLADRPLFVTRFPDGVTGKSFFQKHWEPAPPFARTVAIHSEPQRARRRLPHLREPRDPALARPDGRARAARLVLAHRSGARRRGPEPEASPARRPRWSGRS